jgi:WD40 repeat protein
MESFPHPIVMIGLDEDWPSSITAQTYRVSAHCLSSSEDILATGGEREGLAVYSVWDTKTGDGKTFVHPCKTHICQVRHVSFDQSRGNVELRTGCECGELCRWDISSNSHSLLEQIQIGSQGPYIWWADDGSKAVCGIVDERLEVDGDEGTLYRLSISGSPPISHSLLTAMRYTRWWFSPGHGDKVVGVDHEKLALWECSSGRQNFQKAYEVGTTCSFPHFYFSPDGTMIAFIGGGVAKLISAEDGTVFHSWNLPGEVQSIQFFPEGETLVGRDGCKVYLLDGDIVHEKEIYCDAISISPDGQRVATISRNGVDIFNKTLDEKLEKYEPNVSNLYSYHFSWIHSTLVCIDYDTLSFHHFSGNIRPGLSVDKISRVRNLLLSPHNRHLLTLHEDNSIHVWDVKSGQRLHNDIPNFSDQVCMEYAPDSSCALVRDENQLVVLQYSTGHIKWVPVISRSRSGVLAATFFQDSTRILVIEADGNMATVSLPDLSRYSMPCSRSQLANIRQLVISPTEELLAICSDLGLIIQGTCRDIDRAPLLSNQVKSAVFSPDGIYLYTAELVTKLPSCIMISCVDSQNWTIRRIFSDTIDRFTFGITLSICNWDSIEHDVMGTDRFSALIVSFEGSRHHRDIFLSLSTSRQIIPPSSWFSSDQLSYRDQWLMTLPTQYLYKTVMNQGHLAYIDGGKAVVVDHSSLIKQM